MYFLSKLSSGHFDPLTLDCWTCCWSNRSGEWNFSEVQNLHVVFGVSCLGEGLKIQMEINLSVW